MSETANETGGAGPSHRGVEAGITVLIAIFGLISVIGAVRVGTGWGDEGPKAGFFPFYIGLIIVIASAVNLVNLLKDTQDHGDFASWSQLAKVASVVVPTAIYVAMLPYIGIYVSSALLIAAFMMWFGRYNWAIALPIAIAMPLVTFVLFERWFLVPLPKGPLEKMLGF